MMNTKPCFAALLTAVSAASALYLGGPSPAAATTAFCVGQGTAITGPLYYPVTGGPPVTMRQPSTVGFAFNFVVGGIGTCVSGDGTLGKQLTAGGTLTGWCGHSSGQGSTQNGRTFALIGVGSFLVLTGHAVGIVHLTPDVLGGQSCMTGVTRYLVTGAVLLTHCALLTSALVTVPILSTLTTPVSDVGVHTGPLNYHLSVCIPGSL